MRRVATLVSVAALACTALVVTPGTAAATGLPTVSAVSPNRGPDAGGTSVTVTGTNLTGATAVYFGAVAGTSIVVGSATSLTVTSPAQTSATVDITVVTPSGTSLTSAADVYTYEKVLFTDSFTNATTAEPMYLPAGTGTTNVACLTAGSSTTQTPIPDCSSSGGDTAGNGVLRLTSNANSLEGSAFYSTSLPTANGLDLTFNTYQYGSSSEADGIAFSLGATDPANPSAPVNMGPAGGHLGYSGGTSAPSGVGLAHGYMGFGLDVYGNFTSSSYDGSGCTDPSWLTSSTNAQNVTVRGPGSGMVGYCVLDSTLNPSHGGGLGGKKLDNISGTDSTRSTSLVPVEVALNPSTAPATTATGITIPAASWAIQFTPIAGTAKLLTGSLPTIANGLYPSSWINQATGMPYTLTFGWVASTGGSTDVHAVSNVRATTLQPLSSTVFTLTNTDSGSSSLTGGSSYTSTLTPTLNAQSGVEQHPITVAGTYPAGLVPTTITGGTGWTNCQVTGQTFSCTYPASATSPVTAGTTLPAIQVGFTVKSGASLVTNANVVQGQVTAADALPASGNDYTTVSYGTTTVTSMTPTQGSTSGGTAVVITGTNMYGVTGVTFDGTAGTSISHDSNTQLTVYSPAHAAATKSVVLSYGTSSTVTAGNFTWNVNAPTITSISPGSGPTSGGTVVTIIGTNFTPTSTVLFGTNAGVSFTYVSSTQITVTSPPGTAGPAVDVTTTNGTGSTAYGNGFVYYTTPVVSGLTPVQGPATGFTTVNISGSGFTSVTGVDFGGTAASSYTINSDTSITASTPAHAAGATTAHLTYGGGTVSAGTFTFVAAPTFTQMTPSSGSTAGGTTVTITGANLQGASVSVGGIPGTSVTVAPDGNSLTFVTPAGVAGATAVTVGAIGGNVSAGNFTYVAPPVVSGFTPTSGLAAGGTSVVITGTGFTGATAVNFGGTAAASFVVNSDTQITAVSPAGSGAVTVGVTTPYGSGTAAGTFTYIPPPSVTGLSPTSGPASGGTSVTITGTGFTAATAVKFGGTNAASYVVNSDTSITAVTAAGTGSVSVSVTTANGTGTSSGSFTFLPAPTVTGLSPNFGPEAGGTSVVITGTGFTGATAVKFGATNAASYTVNSATQITAVSPAGTGSVNVSVTTPNGTGTSSGTFGYQPAPTISGLSPTSGPAAGGTSVIITGTGFSSATAVKFGATNAASYTVNSATQITAVSPAGTGAVTVSVTTIGGTGTSAGTFTYVPAPTVTGLAPTSGPAAGGTSVVITGTNFTGATAVKFGTTNATSFTVNSATQITAVSPAGTGAVTVSVTTLGGTGTSAGTFTFVPAPTISGLAPTSGPESGGTTVVITGTNFTGATAVQFGGVAATSYAVNSATQITAITPARTGSVTVTVTTANGTGTSSATFTFLPAPTVTGLAPTSGPEAGGTSVVITGTGFTGATAVSFGATAATSFTVNSATQITAVSPAGVGAVTVTVTTPNGSGTSVGTFSYVPAPNITSFSPTSGPQSGGTAVTITGTGFTGATAVLFGSTNAASFTVNSATSITAVSPAGTGAVNLSVTTANGTGVSFGTFTFLPPPAISGLTPTTGPAAGGTTVTITGTGFTGATVVQFGSTNATSYTVNSATQITAVSPAGSGAVTVSVTTANGTGTSVGTFGYQPAPSISGFTPTWGPVAGGTAIDITGNFFTGATAVLFGGTPATTFNVASPTDIYAVSPAGSGAVNVTVTTANGTASSFGTFTYVPVPAISSLTPGTGPESGGTLVVITGTGLTGATVVDFGSTPATSYSVDSATQITALSPAGTGAVTVSVTTPGGSTTSAGTFSYVAAGGGLGGSGGGSGGGGGGSGSGGGGGGGLAGALGGLTVTRIGGPDRDATANLISQAMYPTAHSAQVVILARDDVFADALAGSPMSKVFNGPVLLTPSHSLSASAQAGIVRVLNPGDTVYVLGGTSAISDNVLAQIKALGFVTVRIGGTDRYGTAALIAAKLSTSETVTKVYLATGVNFPDALSAASAAGSTAGVILLTADTIMPSETSSWLAAHSSLPRIAVGGQAATASPGATVMAGADRYQTAADVAAATFPTPTGLLLATGVNFPDALAGAAYAAQQGWGLLLVDPGTTSVTGTEAQYLRDVTSSLLSIVILGGTTALPDSAAAVIVTAVTPTTTQ